VKHFGNELEHILERERRAKLICSELNNFVDLKSILTTVINHIKELTGCEAVGVRLHDGEDYPYYVYEGFPQLFIKKENSLCFKDNTGNKIPAPDGKGYLLECLCGCVIKGNTDFSLPFFTEHGSFWSNDMSRPWGEKLELRSRNYCRACGYESVALIPIKARNERFGLVQLNDMRKGMFSEELIEFMEMIGEQIGLAVQNSLIYTKLEEANKYTKEILDNLPIALTTYDSNFRLTFANRKAQEITGYQLGEMEGLSDKEIANMVYRVENNNKSLLRELTGSINTIKNRIRTIKTRSGDCLKISVDAYKLENGGFLYLFDEAKRVQGLENLQLQTQTILNSVSNLVLMIDSNGTIIMCNTALEEAVEMGAEDILGMNILDFMELIQFSRKDLANKDLNESDINAIYEASFITPNGDKKEIILQFAPIHNVDGELIGVIVVASDITILKKEQQREQQQEKLALLGQMATGIVHEIKNPLTSILGFSQVITLKSQDEKIKGYARLIEKEVHGLNKIVSDFLAFAKPRSPILNEVSLNDIVDSMKLMLETNVVGKGIKISYHLVENIKPVMADENQIKQVILNIVKNAIDVLKGTDNPEIKISSGYSQIMNESFITIFNNGKSMSEEEKRMVGTPFFTTKKKGTGLGLSICHQIMKEHGGRIDFESEPGIGTSFTLHLPTC
jgi:PAS domain S-box-containing protein